MRRQLRRPRLKRSNKREGQPRCPDTNADEFPPQPLPRVPTMASNSLRRTHAPHRPATVSLLPFLLIAAAPPGLRALSVPALPRAMTHPCLAAHPRSAAALSRWSARAGPHLSEVGPADVAATAEPDSYTANTTNADTSTTATVKIAPAKKVRVDELLVARGIVADTKAAAALVLAGSVFARGDERVRRGRALIAATSHDPNCVQTAFTSPFHRVYTAFTPRSHYVLTVAFTERHCCVRTHTAADRKCCVHTHTAADRNSNKHATPPSLHNRAGLPA